MPRTAGAGASIRYGSPREVEANQVARKPSALGACDQHAPAARPVEHGGDPDLAGSDVHALPFRIDRVGLYTGRTGLTGGLYDRWSLSSSLMRWLAANRSKRKDNLVGRPRRWPQWATHRSRI